MDWDRGVPSSHAAHEAGLCELFTILLLWRSFPWLVHCRFGVCRDGSYFSMCFLLDFFLSARYLCLLCLYVVTDLDTAIAFGILSGQKDWQPHWKRLLPLQPSKGLGLSLFQLAFKGCGAFQTARIFSNRGRAIAKKSPEASSWAGWLGG